MEMLMEAVKASAPPVRDERPPPKGTPHHCHPGSRYFHRRHSFLKRLGYASQSPLPALPVWATREAAKGVVTVITTQPASVCPWLSWWT
ncbi:MAG: hypothetical protein ACLS43_09550 [Evtepia gabavorous]